MSEDKLYAEGAGPGAGNVALCRLADVVGHCMKGQPLMSALRQVTETLRANEDLQMYLDCSPGDFARKITEDCVVWRGRPAKPAKHELIRRGKLGVTEEKWIPGVKAVPDLKGVSGTLELLNKLQVPSNGLKGLASGFVGRLALRESDAAALFGYGQSPSSCDEPARASGSIEWNGPSANGGRAEPVHGAAELAVRAKDSGSGDEPTFASSAAASNLISLPGQPAPDTQHKTNSCHSNDRWTEEEKAAMRKRRENGKTEKQIADEFCTTRQRVGQLIGSKLANKAKANTRRTKEE